MSELKNIRSYVEQMGYHQSQNSFKDPGDALFYTYINSTASVINSVKLRYMSNARGYCLHLAAYNPNASGRLIDFLQHMAPYAKRGLNLQYRSLVCLMWFDVALGLNWKSKSIPQPFDRSLWKLQIDEVRLKLLEPIFWPLKTSFDIVEMLMRDDCMFRWSIGSNVLRAAEIITILKIEGFCFELINKFIEEKKLWIERDLKEGVSSEEFAKFVYHNV